MTKIQLEASIIGELKKIFELYPQIESVKLYGSRAMGTAKNNSDIDLVAFGENLDRFVIAEVLLDLNDSDIPYLIDLQSYNEIKNLRLKDHINRIGVVIYNQKNFPECLDDLAQQDAMHGALSK